jgi:2-haloacid dehalogenase
MDLAHKDVLTFDCYGTLIDWETGILSALQPVLRAHHITLLDDVLLKFYAELEALAEEGPYRPYPEVLATVMHGLGERLGFGPTPADVAALAGSVARWPAFPDSPAALAALKRRFKLAIISNIDDELFVASNRRLGVEFDWVISAQQAQSYKPSTNNFRIAFERIGLPRERLLHVAQSLFHDHVPAKALGLDTVWVNRRQTKPGFGATPPATAQPDLEVPDMQTLAEVLTARS